MEEQQHPISSYSWSILVDVHSKIADFEGCGNVIKEMVSHGVAPSQAAYTSLLSACYKVCNDGRIPHAVRAKAGEFGWQQWQEMRIVGINPDAMAYGAIIRLCAARGRPERAINLLEEMQRFGVKPTTLCFSSALRAVAKSHEIAVRFERGWSRKQLRRETFAAHHGQMARTIVIMAENAEVDIDDGFISALMLCAAAAGDSATAKAVYLAGEVRKMDQLRTIGPESHLKRLRGHDDSEQVGMEKIGAGSLSKSTSELPPSLNADCKELSSDGTSSIRIPGKRRQQQYPSYGEREYGKDTRSLSALLRACAQAVQSNGIGTIWAGRQNQGYLCENSLRLITTRWEPRYTNNDIPGTNSTKLGISNLRQYDEDKRERNNKVGVRKKFRGLFLDDDAAITLDELDEATAKMFVPEDGESELEGDLNYDRDNFLVHDESMPSGTGPNTARLWGNEEFLSSKSVNDAASLRKHSQVEIMHNNQSAHDQNGTSMYLNEKAEEEWFFDKEVMRWKSRPKALVKEIEGLQMDLGLQSLQRQVENNMVSSVEELESEANANETVEEELYFDKDSMRWKSRPKAAQENQRSQTEFELQSMKSLNSSHNSMVESFDNKVRIRNFLFSSHTFARY